MKNTLLFIIGILVSTSAHSHGQHPKYACKAEDLVSRTSWKVYLTPGTIPEDTLEQDSKLKISSYSGNWLKVELLDSGWDFVDGYYKASCTDHSPRLAMPIKNETGNHFLCVDRVVATDNLEPRNPGDPPNPRQIGILIMPSEDDCWGVEGDASALTPGHAHADD